MNMRLIDGDKLLEWLGDHISHHEESNALVDKGVVFADKLLRDKINLGNFDIPSNQEEAASLRDDITEAISIWECMAMDDDIVITIDRIIRKLREALSSHTGGGPCCDLNKLNPYNAGGNSDE